MSFNLSFLRRRLFAARSQRLSVIALAFAAIATQACGGGGGDGGGTTPPVAVASIDVAPSPLSVTAGLTSQLSATTKSAAGATLNGRSVSWSSADQTIATVSTSGLVTGVKAGSTTVTATSEGVHKDVAVTVTAAPIASIDVTPSPLSISLGQSAQLTATPKSSTGASLTDRQVTWSTVDGTIASVSASGLVAALKVGTTTITATSEGIHKDIAVTVALASVASVVFTTQPTNALAGAPIAPAISVQLLDAGGSVVPTTASVTVTLTGGDPAASLAGTATVNAINGVATFTNLSIGRAGSAYHLVANAGGIQATSAAFNISAAAVATIAFVAQPQNTVAGASIAPVSMQLLDGNGNVVPTNAAVTLTLTGGPGGVSLVTPATANAVNGVATFSNLSITRKGSAYQLVATASGKQGTSAAFDIWAAAPASITKLAGDSQPAIAGRTLPTAPSVQVSDAYGNTVDTTMVTFAANSSGSVAGGSQRTNANGVATVDSWTVGVMGPNTLTATAGSVSTAFTASVTGGITPGIWLVVDSLGSAPTASVAVGHDIPVPLALDLSNRGTADLGAIQLRLNWDPALLTFKSASVGNWTSNVIINADSAATGVFRIAGFTTSATLTSAVLEHLVFTGAASGTVNITATIGAAANAAGTRITVLPRPLTVTVTP